jgi:glycosyltransferase involved in cell wall biosynthesis
MAPRVLWVRHTPRASGRVTRDMHLLPRLSSQFDLHVLTWKERASSLREEWKRLIPRYHVDEGIPTWTLPSLPKPPGWRRWWRSINEPMFRGAIHAIERRIQPDLIVVGPSWFTMGLPPSTRAIRVFDYLDGADWRLPHWRGPETAYLDWSDATICVSEVLAARVTPWRKPALVAPNGVELERLIALREDREDVRRRLGVHDRDVVSLIGLTAAPSRYWVEAIRTLAAEHPRFLFLAVGTGREFTPLFDQLSRELGSSLRWMGPVSYEEALDCFVASDVTWYPAEDNEYFHAASPLKIYEGLAAGAQVVVAPRLRGLGSLEAPSLHFADPTVDGLVQVTRAAFGVSPASAELVRSRLRDYSWDHIAKQIAAFFQELIGSAETLRQQRRR